MNLHPDFSVPHPKPPKPLKSVEKHVRCRQFPPLEVHQGCSVQILVVPQGLHFTVLVDIILIVLSTNFYLN